MYRIHEFDAMFTDPVRSTAYLAAIERVVRPGDVVVEIGTGVGFFAVAACRAGARHVYAIEMNPVVALAPDVLAANNCADRVTVIQGNSRRVALPERGDVLLEDLRGVLPLHDGHIDTLVDARARLLRDGARIIPLRDRLWAAPCGAMPDFREHHVIPGDAPFGIVRSTVAAHVRQDWYRIRCLPELLAAAPSAWAEIDYVSVTSPDITGVASWSVERSTVVDGICVWFDAELAEGIGFSNAPWAEPVVYGHAFFPLERSITVEPGDSMRTEFTFRQVNGEYVHVWNTSHRPRPGDGRPAADFHQSTLPMIVLGAGESRRFRDDHTPSPTGDTRLLQELLVLADGSRSLREIAAELTTGHPDRFLSTNDALRYATRALAKFEELLENPAG